MRRAAAATLLAPAALLAGCGILAPEEDYTWAEFNAAVARWDVQGLLNYEYIFQRQVGEGLPEWQQPFLVRVADGQVVHIGHAQTGAPPPDGFTAPTVPELFAIAEDALENAHVVLVEYHPSLGYPTLISVDLYAEMVDDEFVITATALTPVQLLTLTCSQGTSFLVTIPEQKVHNR